MRLRPRLLALLAALIAAGCNDKNLPSSGDVAAQLQTPPSGSVLVVPSTDDPKWPADAFTVVSARIDGQDTLRLELTHGGGCATHRYQLLVGSAFMESFPVQVGARLSHDAGGDRCKALLRPTLRVDLAPLRELYQRAYQRTSGTIDIQLRGTQTIRYAF